MFGHQLEYLATTLSCSPSTVAVGTLFWDQAWPEGHLAMEKMMLEVSQLGWQRPPHTADHLSEAEPCGRIAAAPCCPHGLCCGTEGPSASNSHRQTQCECALEEAPRLCCARSSEIRLV